MEFSIPVDIHKKVSGYTEFVSENISNTMKNIAVLRDGIGMVTTEIEIRNREGSLCMNVPKGRIVFRGVEFGYKKSS